MKPRDWQHPICISAANEARWRLGAQVAVMYAITNDHPNRSLPDYTAYLLGFGGGQSGWWPIWWLGHIWSHEIPLLKDAFRGEVHYADRDVLARILRRIPMAAVPRGDGSLMLQVPQE